MINNVIFKYLVFTLSFLKTKEKLKYIIHSLSFMRAKAKKNYAAIFVSLFIAFIMITSVIGYIFGDSGQSTARYNGITFTLTSNGWKTVYQGRQYTFSFLPQDLKSINLSDSIVLKDTLQLDVTYDYNSSFAQEIASSIFEFSEIAIQKDAYLRQGFTSNISENFPVITCETANEFVPVIYFTESNETKISSDGSCIIVESRDANGFLPLADKLAYNMLGIE